ncbi:MAG: thiazole synthase [Planctomycetota bacterium]|nr:MAG: thiazole synthase [Planctomycetota bacterium]
MSEEILKIGKYEFKSRLIVGTGKYRNFEEMREALDASGADCVTVAVRMMDFDSEGKGILDYINTEKFKILPNTAGCYNAEDAIRHCELARETGISDMVKLEVLGDKQTLLPDPVETLKAAEHLVKNGFTVLVYTSDDPIVARKLEDLGVAAVMPAGAPIGSGQGILNPNAIRIILEQVTAVPVIVDAGVGTASDVTQAFELGVDGVLLNTGIALAKKPVLMAKAMKAAAEAGRHAFLAGRIPKKLYATASSPTEGLIK